MRKISNTLQVELDRRTDFQLLCGSVVEVTTSGEILVECEGNGSSLFCSFLRTSAAPPPTLDTGDRVVFLAAEIVGRGYVLGVIETHTKERAPDCLRVTAKKRLELRCGKSSLTMNDDGRVVVRGAELTSRASGVNKIKGAAVKIN